MKKEWKASQYKGFVSLDVLFSAIPVILMIIYTLNYSALYLDAAERSINAQSDFDRLVSVSDLVVKNLGACEEKNFNPSKSKIVPNKIDLSKLNDLDRKDLAEQAGFKTLEISFEPSEGTCIYRLVVLDSEIKKLYFCGD
ncbi:hypothetical protein JXB01_03030 [Candidatus Micrarchaeota archaeon]|nr:hypothetical protein [Candidatus Micrarchaeota archaeon]